MKFILALLLTLPLTSSSFTPSARLVSQPTTVRSSSSSALTAAQKRRRRKTAPPASPTAPSSDDDLPDFDDDDGYESGDGERSGSVASAEPTPKRKTQPSSVVPIRRGAGLNPKLAEEVGGNVDGLDEEIILEAMRGRTGDKEWQPPRSIQDTINDRSLEKLMDFDRMIERDGGGGAVVVELPEFDDVISRRKRQDAMREGRVEDAAILIETSGMGKKAARDAERRALAMEREREEAEAAQKSPFADLNVLKVLENGAWAGIGLLVLWEFYINSPLFQRAAPLIPVVYDTVPPGM
jgi:hypothetical protein